MAWGDGFTDLTTDVALTNGVIPDQTHTYADNGSYTVTISVANADGAGAVESATIHVANVVPEIFVDNVNALTVPEGGNLQVTGHFTDPGADSWQASWETGESGLIPVELESDKTFSFSIPMGDGPGTYSFNLYVADDEQMQTVSYLGSQLFVTAQVTNVAPTATLNAPASVARSGQLTFQLQNPVDPSDADELAGFEYSFSCDGGATFSTPSSSPLSDCGTPPRG